MAVEVRDEHGVVRVRPTAGEKVAFSVAVAVITALLLWNGKTTLETSQAVAVLNTKLDGITAVAAAEQGAYDGKLEELDRRVTKLEALHDRQ